MYWQFDMPCMHAKLFWTVSLLKDLSSLQILEVAFGCRATHRVVSVLGGSFFSKLQHLINAQLKHLYLHEQ